MTQCERVGLILRVKLREVLEVGSRRFYGAKFVYVRCNAHQPVQAETGCHSDFIKQGTQIPGSNTSLRLAVRHVHLQQDSYRSSCCDGPGRLGAGVFQTVDAVYEVKVVGGSLGLVGLQATNEMPDWPVAKFDNLGYRFLHAVLAKVGDPRRDSRCSVVNWPCLAHTDEGYVGGVASRSVRRLFDPRSHLVDAVLHRHAYSGQYGGELSG